MTPDAKAKAKAKEKASSSEGGHSPDQVGNIKKLVDGNMDII